MVIINKDIIYDLSSIIICETRRDKEYSSGVGQPKKCKQT